MANCKNIRRTFRLAAREERAARAAVRTANAKVVELTKKLAPSYVETAQANAERNAVKPFVAEAQAASNRWWKAADDLSNAARHLNETKCSRKGS
jgi:hypothetical protein